MSYVQRSIVNGIILIEIGIYGLCLAFLYHPRVFSNHFFSSVLEG